MVFDSSKQHKPLVTEMVTDLSSQAHVAPRHMLDVQRGMLDELSGHIESAAQLYMSNMHKSHFARFGLGRLLLSEPEVTRQVSMPKELGTAMVQVAAADGNKYAQYFLGVVYSREEGYIDLEKAQYWLSLSPGYRPTDRLMAVVLLRNNNHAEAIKHFAALVRAGDRSALEFIAQAKLAVSQERPKNVYSVANNVIPMYALENSARVPLVSTESNADNRAAPVIPKASRSALPRV